MVGVLGARRKARERALPLPLVILGAGVGISIGSWLLVTWSWRATLIQEFKRDAAALAYQVTSRMARDVDEKYITSFMRYAGAKLNTFESWTGFTDQWTVHNVDGTVIWAPRVRSGNTTAFYEAAERAYPDLPGGARIYDMTATGDIVYRGNNETEDMWPILYASPDVDIVGFNVGSLPERADAIERMLDTNDTTIPDVVVSRVAGLPQYAVLQPVFEGPLIVGLTGKSTAIHEYFSSSLDALSFSERYPGGHAALFMRVGFVDHDDQLLFDLKIDPDYTGDDFLAGRITPMEVKGRGRESFTSEVALTKGKSALLVASFNPDVNSRSRTLALVAGCVASALVALLVYGRQVLMLSYKDGMERATAMSTFKSRFVADMSHEIRTPLNGIIGTVELLTEENLGPNAGELVGTVQACSNILLGIVNDALDFSKIEAGKLRVEAAPAFLGQTFMDVMQVMRSTYRSPTGDTTADVRLRLEVEETVPRTEVLADVGRIRQVAVNLVSNAFKFTDRGSITVTARCEPYTAAPKPLHLRKGDGMDERTTPMFSFEKTDADNRRVSDPGDEQAGATGEDGVRPSTQAAKQTVECTDDRRVSWRCCTTWRARNSHGEGEVGEPPFVNRLISPAHDIKRLVVEITDTGAGMTRDQMNNLYQPFSQVHLNKDRAVGGTGLGLAISKSLCESMGGMLGCRSKPGLGSTFFFSVLVATQIEIGDDEETDRASRPRDLEGDPTRATDGSDHAREKRPPIITKEWDLAIEKGRGWAKADISALRGHRKASSSGSVKEYRPSQKVLPEELVAGEDGPQGAGCRGFTMVPGPGHPRRGRGSRGGRCANSTAGASIEDIWFAAVKQAGSGGEQGPTRPLAVTAQHRPRFLIVDDIRVNRLVMRKMLEALDVEVELAEDGVKAVEACRRTRFSLILMDVMMPVMDGFEAARLICLGEKRGLNRKTPIIAVTASPTLQGSEAGDASGFTDLLPKPVMRKNLFNTIAKWADAGDVKWMGDAWRRHTGSSVESFEGRLKD